MAVIEVPVERIKDRQTFHEVFAEVLGFPSYYGNNLDAFIDCLTYIGEEGYADSSVRLEEGETLTLYLGDHIDEFRKRCPEQLEALEDCVAFINLRAIDRELPPRILLAYG